MPETIRTTAGAVHIRFGTVDELMNLRHAVLRPGLPRESANFPADHNPDTRHVIALLNDARVIGCATWNVEPWNGVPAWHLRGMATDSEFRGAGVGRALLAYSERRLLEDTPVRLVWCNARTSAVRFYEKFGWQTVSDVFELPPAGPHVRMTKLLAL